MSEFLIIMKKTLGIFFILLTIMILTAIAQPSFLNGHNLSNLAKWTGLFGILTIGAAFVIITGGIDLSIGAVVGLSGVTLSLLITEHKWSPGSAVLAVLLLSLVIGLIHALLITKLKLQPFVVTLCGLFFYRGMARYLAEDRVQTFQGAEGLLAFGKYRVFDFLPMPFLLFLFIAGLAAVFLNLTIYGRYLLALGKNEVAARFSGINTDRMTMVSYLVCSLLAGLGGILFALDVESVQPSTFGNFYELYAIAGAVLGGCSLRGGEASILGLIFGTAIVRVLRNASNVLDVPSQLEFAVVGMVILLGVIADELIKRYAERRRLQMSGR